MRTGHPPTTSATFTIRPFAGSPGQVVITNTVSRWWTSLLPNEHRTIENVPLPLSVAHQVLLADAPSMARLRDAVRDVGQDGQERSVSVEWREPITTTMESCRLESDGNEMLLVVALAYVPGGPEEIATGARAIEPASLRWLAQTMESLEASVMGCANSRPVALVRVPDTSCFALRVGGSLATPKYDVYFDHCR